MLCIRNQKEIKFQWSKIKTSVPDTIELLYIYDINEWFYNRNTLKISSDCQWPRLNVRITVRLRHIHIYIKFKCANEFKMEITFKQFYLEMNWKTRKKLKRVKAGFNDRYISTYYVIVLLFCTRKELKIKKKLPHSKLIVA